MLLPIPCVTYIHDYDGYNVKLLNQLWDNYALRRIIYMYNYWTKLVHEYRDRIYIRKDILLKLYEYGELNQSKLMSYCGLNNVKHKGILDDMVEKEMIIRTEEPWGNKTVIKYRVSEKGNDILREILEPYESLFPRDEKKKGNNKNDSFDNK